MYNDFFFFFSLRALNMHSFCYIFCLNWTHLPVMDVVLSVCVLMFVLKYFQVSICARKCIKSIFAFYSHWPLNINSSISFARSVGATKFNSNETHEKYMFTKTTKFMLSSSMCQPMSVCAYIVQLILLLTFAAIRLEIYYKPFEFACCFLLSIIIISSVLPMAFSRPYIANFIIMYLAKHLAYLTHNVFWSHFSSLVFG